MSTLTRRGFIGGCFALSACGQVTQTPAQPRNWQNYFASLDQGAILIDTQVPRLYFWQAGNAEYAEFPVGIARSETLLRRGRTKVVRKKVGPGWTPTPSMRAKYPDLPAYVPPGPANPMGPYAMYLGWTYYAIHGTNDPRSVGYPTTSGCFRMFNGNVKWLFERVRIGTQVYVI